jgi:hypothetical protein
LSEICNDLILAQSMPSRAVHPITPINMPRPWRGHDIVRIITLAIEKRLPLENQRAEIKIGRLAIWPPRSEG